MDAGLAGSFITSHLLEQVERNQEASTVASPATEMDSLFRPSHEMWPKTFYVVSSTRDPMASRLIPSMHPPVTGHFKEFVYAEVSTSHEVALFNQDMESIPEGEGMLLWVSLVDIRFHYEALGFSSTFFKFTTLFETIYQSFHSLVKHDSLIQYFLQLRCWFTLLLSLLSFLKRYEPLVMAGSLSVNATLVEELRTACRQVHWREKVQSYGGLNCGLKVNIHEQCPELKA